ncbi:hypothetical protein D5S17_35415 [Pseudonocardiaceae bacterium YIM PH 21723]|nr:hypothetical protein D5S17_35415 [Pseudonocardiaceae bacterium YIM PH 21723]
MSTTVATRSAEDQAEIQEGPGEEKPKGKLLRLFPRTERRSSVSTPYGELQPVGELTDFVQHAEELLKVQANPALLDVLSVAESREEREGRERVRRARRKAKVTSQLREVEQQDQEEQAFADIARRDSAERVVAAKARRRRKQITDPNASLALYYWRYRMLTRVLMALTLIGLVFCAVAVHHDLVGVEGSWTFYLTDCIFAIPILVLLAVQITVAEVRAGASARELRDLVQHPGIIATEIVLLLAHVLLNVQHAIWARPFDGALFVGRLVPPLVVSGAVLGLSFVTFVFGRILAGIYLPGDDTRLDPDVDEVIEHIVQAWSAVLAGQGQLQPDGLPSKEFVRRTIGKGQRASQGVHDAMGKLAAHGIAPVELTRRSRARTSPLTRSV